jgi:hypothetical protein
VDLIAVAGLKDVEYVIDEVVDLYDRIVAEPGQGDGCGVEVIGGKPLRG